MGIIIDLEQARERRDAAEPVDPVLRALDEMALALAEHGHCWSDDLRQLYEGAVERLQGCG